MTRWLCIALLLHGTAAVAQSSSDASVRLGGVPELRVHDRPCLGVESV